jgi:hypothetical protein
MLPPKTLESCEILDVIQLSGLGVLTQDNSNGTGLFAVGGLLQ